MMSPHERYNCTHVVTGKPIEAGGSFGRNKATGQGVVFTIEQWAKDNNIDLSNATFIVQGYGNVASWSARLLGVHGTNILHYRVAKVSLPLSRIN